MSALRKARQVAAQRGTTISEVLEEMLRDSNPDAPKAIGAWLREGTEYEREDTGAVSPQVAK